MKPRRINEALAAITWPIIGIGAVAILVRSLPSGWTLRGWLGEAAQIVWPLAFLSGLAFLLAAHAAKKTEKQVEEKYKNREEAHLWMRRAALSFLLSLFALWLLFQGYLPRSRLPSTDDGPLEEEPAANSPVRNV
jgi:hypothetical protein